MRAWLAAVVCVTSGACGDNVLPLGEPVAPASDLTIVAHQDDDLLLMQPDLYDAVQRGTGVTNVYVTAGNGLHGLAQIEARYDGLMAAYSAITGAYDWSCGWIRLASNDVEHCRLATAKISLIFLGYPDGGKQGEAPDSLLHLWEGTIDAASAIGRRATSYRRSDLIRVLADIIDATAPATLRTLEIASTHGYDHSDHMLVGALAVLATAASARDPELVSYRGYNTGFEPENADPTLFARSAQALGYYEACATGCAPCGDACAIDPTTQHAILLARRYAIGMRRAAAGKLRLGDGCVTATRAGAGAAIGDCALAPAWQLDNHGTLRTSNDLCLEVSSSGEILAAACGPGPSGPGARFFLDDEGHLWSGAVPAPQANMDLAHLSCVGSAGGRPLAELCGAELAPALELTTTTTTTPRDTTTLTRTGRAVRIATFPQQPLPMLCAIETGARGLMCAPGSPGGGLLPAVRIDSAAAPLAIEPESLTLGDVDGDSLTDACGRDAGGILCATAASGYQPARWTTVLGASGPATPTDRSLAIAPGGKICGLGDPGVVCVPRSATAITDVRSTWPDRRAALWIADLDGDRQPDWCAATPGGLACSLAADRALTTDGIAWGYAFGGLIETSAASEAIPEAIPDTATAAFTDIDGDGRDDLCTARDGAIACARSLGRGFGPRTPIARLPTGMTPTALWAESTESAGSSRTGRAPQICAADATAIACTDEREATSGAAGTPRSSTRRPAR